MGTGVFLSIDNIVTEGLDLGGNPGLTTRATTFLKMLLDHMYRSYDWEFLLKSVTVTSQTNGSSTFEKVPNTALPSDYRAVRQIFIINHKSGPQPAPLVQMPYEQLLVNIQNDIQMGTVSATAPTYFAVDTGNGAGSADIYLWPRPDVACSCQIRYYRLPDVSTYTTGVKTDFPDTWALVGAVAHYAQAYDKESLQQIIQAEAKVISDEYRLNHRDAGRAGVEVVPWDTATFRTLKQDGQLPWPRPQ